MNRAPAKHHFLRGRARSGEWGRKCLPPVRRAAKVAAESTFGKPHEKLLQRRLTALIPRHRSGGSGVLPSGVFFCAPVQRSTQLRTLLLLRLSANRCRLILCVCLGLAAALANSAFAQTLRTVALTGQHAPGTPNDVVFDSLFGFPALNNLGQTAFIGQLSGRAQPQPDFGFWSEASGTLSYVASQGDHAAGTPNDVVFDEFFTPSQLSDLGHSAFSASILDPNLNVGVWTHSGTTTTLFAHEGGNAPGTPNDVRFGVLGFLGIPPTLNAVGHSTGRFNLTGPGVDPNNDIGIWSDRTGSVDLVFRTGQHAPGTPNDVVFDALGLPQFNAADHIAFNGRLTGPGVDPNNEEGIWSDRSGGFDLLIRGGDPAPGTPNDTVFQAFALNSMNDSGKIAFSAVLDGNDVFLFDDFSIWTDRTGAFEMIARENDPIPGGPATTRFGGLGPTLLNNANDLAFFATLDGPGTNSSNDQSLWSDAFGPLEMILRTGDFAPGTPNDVVFDSFRTTGVGFNDLGQIAVLADLTGPGIDTSNDRGIWAQYPNGTFHLIARKGDPLTVGLGDTRIIKEIGFWDALNDYGQLAFVTQFDDDSLGIFVTDLVAIPEPTTGLLASFGALVLLGRCRRRSGR